MSSELLTVDGLDMRQAHMGVTTRSGRYSLPGVRGEGLTVAGRSGYIFTPNRPLEPGIGALNCWCLGATSKQSVLEENRLTNPSFETNLTNWTPAGGTIAQVDTPWSLHGTKGMSFSNTTAGVPGYVGGGGSGVSNFVPCLPGEYVGATISLKATRAFQVVPYIYWVNNAATVIGSGMTGTATQYAAGEYKTSATSWFPAAPAGTAATIVFWYVYEPNSAAPAFTGEYYVADAVRHDTIAASALPTRTLSVGNGSSIGWVWSGTPHASPSIRYDYDLVVPRGEHQRRKALEDNIGWVQRLFSRRHRLLTIRSYAPSDGTVRRAFVEPDDMGEVTVEAGGTRANFSIGYSIPDVFWEDEVARTQAALVGTSQPKALDLTQFADMTGWIEDGVFTVAGPITNPRITDAETGAWVQYTGTVPTGQNWVVDSANFTSTVNGASVMAATKHVGGYRLLVIPNLNGTSGTPRLTLTGTTLGATTNLSVTARRKWFSG